ncbi:hypothetical protein EGY31_14755 [Burkholderia multivorans]|uniref:hypothetical protein n=1 Tax=Burkholderia ubonensis TaxID=101571 RepID=UPI0007538F19|nr:hypothetical protein [Burkholderia ubonensis]AYZ65082.1 hypothetical protein EGY31_14755 [Burkholderia multivorans]AOI68614.1 hypothetical protein WI31_03400 [Burkholderia ubonensis]KUZ23032.1 hypothetical protein WI29_12580 [Burkholderia ubonensis]KUZ24780.1 hypothetical protein WI32_33750 [Burkholderia ubonensis]KUZ36712.1 hypothetical protein WI30_08330 [Burkholderia ubonensis]
MSHATFRSESGYRATYQTDATACAAPAAGAPAAGSPAAGSPALPDTLALVALARDAGMLVTLDATIGRERYESVTGSIATLARFAQALQLAMREAA